MPHQCVRCGSMYPDGAKEILSGCNCGSRFFFFISKEKLEKSQDIEFTKEERKKIEDDVKELVEVSDIKDDETVFLDVESIKVLKQGDYQIDLIDLFKGKPLVYKLEDGKYMIDLASTFKSSKKKK